MKKLFVLFISMAVCAIAMAGDVSGNIIINTTWDIAGSPYTVIGDVTVDAGITLTIDPNVVVEFNNSRNLNTYGTINATSATFTSSNAVPAVGDWNYIRFYTGSTSTFSGCNIEYGDYLDVAAGAVLNINSSSIIEKMYYYGIYNLGTVNFTNSTIDLTDYVSYGYGIYTAGSSITNLNTATISNCLHGVYVFSEGSDIDLTNSVFSSNEWPVYLRYLGDITTGAGNNFSGNTRDAFYVYPSAMNKNWTMPYTSPDVPYYFRSYFDVNNTYTLTIEEENIIKFPLNDGLRIYGKLVADAVVDWIYFTSDRDDNWGGDTNNDGAATAPAVSNWEGIQFFDASDNTSVMRRCQIRYAGQGSIGGISLYDAGPIIEYCELQQNYFGAYFQYASNPTFNYNTVGSSTLTPIAMSFEANPTFIDNELSFSDNQYDAIGLLGGTLTADAYVIKRDFTTVVNITYVMLAQITVPNGRLLDIEEGVVIKSPSHTYRLLIYGKLVCDGIDYDNRIVFTSVKDDNFGNPNDTNKDGTQTSPAIHDMGAIIFEDGHDDTSILNFVLMKYAGVYSWYYSNGGSNHYMHSSAIAVRSLLVTPAGPTISNCEIREANYGIACYQAANPTITNDTIINILQTPFAIAAAATPTFTNNVFINCGLDALGLIGHNVVNNGAIIKRDVAGYINITYILIENITITNTTYLDIDDGVVIKSYRKSWTIDGGFFVNGLGQRVVFTSLRDDNVGNPMDTNGDANATSPAAGDWDHIEFMDESDDTYNQINNADILYGGYSTPYGVVRWTNAGSDGININMNNTVIDRSSTFGLWINGDSDPIIDNTTIQNCSWDPIAISLTSDPTFSNINFAANLSNGIYIIEGLGGTTYNLATNATLNKRSVAGYSNIPYIMDDLTITSNAVLTLEEGIIFKFRDDYFTGILNHGGLNATGTSGQRIIFTSIKDDGAGGDTNNDGSATVPGNNDWDGILYIETAAHDADNILEYCEIRYTGGGHDNIAGGNSTLGAARVKDAGLTINETIFSIGSGSAVGVYGSAYPSVTNCEMYNITGEPIYMAMFANPTFSGNTVANIGRMAIGIQPETYSQTATVPQRNFAGYSNITYIFNGATINSGTTITIPAGTVFKSDYRQDLVVNGTLEVAGASGNEVVFTDYRDDAYGNPADTEDNGSATSPGNYGAEIIFNDVSVDASYINYAFMRYTQYPIQLNSAEPDITNNTFYKCINGVWHSGVCEPVIDNNVFDDLSDAPLAISLVAYPSSTVGNLITGTTYKMIRVNNETLTSNQLLPKRSFGGVTNIPYLFGTYTIGTGVTLNIDPGVICKFINAGGMTVNNGLMAMGTAMSGGYIVFTSITDDFYGGDSNSDGTATSYGSSTWYGITLTEFALPAFIHFDNCIFRWGKYGTGYGIKTISAEPLITNCSFNNCDHGVYATSASNPIINYCDFYNITTMAVNNLNPAWTIDATNCWWGDDTGPTHAGNPGGTGEAVSDFVNYNPYGTSGAINPLLGDVSLNSIIQAYDATLVLLYAMDGGITYPLTPTQLNVADVSGTMGVTPYDANRILRFVVGLESYFDAALLSPLPNIVSEVELEIADATVNPGDEFELPVSISNVSGLFSMQMTLQYDPEFLTAIEFESLLPDMQIAKKIDVEAGTIHVAIAGIESLESDMTIANIKFKATDTQGMATETPVEAEFFMANETDLTWNVHNGIVTINGLAVGLEDQRIDENNQMVCYPNPFTDQLTIKYNVQQDGDNVFIGVYDLFGKLIAEVVNGNHASESYKLVWDGTNSSGTKLKSGIYFIRFTSGELSTTKKIQIVR